MSQVAQPRSEKGAVSVQPAPPLRHFLSIGDLDGATLARLMERAAALKAEGRRGNVQPRLPGVTAALVFQKPSLRTRVSFEVGMLQLGGHALYLSPAEIQLGHREGVVDAARVLSRYVQVIVARVFLHDDVVGLAREASVPVVNALSDLEHPCQVLADLLTLKERFGRLEGLTLTYVGDGNNVASSLLLAAPRAGINVRVATPAGYEPPAAILDAAHDEAGRSGGSVELFTDPHAAVHGADAVYTDAWYSMGQEDEAELRQPLFVPYQVNARLMADAAAHAIVLHCLPAHRGQEITDEVLDGPQCAAYDQAENRLHAQKALLLYLLGSD